jgi:hypothetical protein
MPSSFARGLAFALLVVLTGCNSGSSNPAPAPTASVPCTPPVPVSLVYPAANQTLVPDSTTQIIIATNGALPSTWNVVLSYQPYPAPFGSGAFGGTVQTTLPPFPNGAAVPPYANPTYYSSSIGSQGLPPGALISVGINDTSNSGCYASPLGTFSSQ